MPSISQSKLDELEAAADNAARLAKQERDRADLAERRLRSYDEVLDKIVRAANGQPLNEDRNRNSYGNNFSSYIEGGSPRKLKTEERQEQEIRSLNDRVVDLESRLAAAVAVASFAKGHKA